MQAIRVNEFGGADVLKLEELPRPQPNPGEVLVAIRSIGVNPVDWKIREGRMRERTPLPLTPGQDFAGEVAEANLLRNAPGQLRPGDRVFGFARGSYAQFALAAGDEIAKLPQAVSLEQGAALPTPGLTASQMITRAAVRPGQTILIHGAGGSVGSIAVQLARLAGATVIATVLGDDAAYVGELGAERVINGEQQRFEESAGQVDAVLDVIGDDVQRRSWRLIRDGGCLISSVGLAGGPEQQAAERRGVRAVAFFMQRDRAGLERLAAMVADGELQVRIGPVIAFPDARQAQQLTQQGSAHGKVLLRVA